MKYVLRKSAKVWDSVKRVSCRRELVSNETCAQLSTSRQSKSRGQANILLKANGNPGARVLKEFLPVFSTAFECFGGHQCPCYLWVTIQSTSVTAEVYIPGGVAFPDS
jgi:hypothetical protein